MISYLGLGSNLGNKRLNINKAVALINEKVGDVLAFSGFYETQSWGYESKESYLNVAVKIETTMSPLDLLHETQLIERELGRIEKTVNGEYHDRVIDIDILTYEDFVIKTPELTIPHPLMHKRLFVLQPLAEIAPMLQHPLFRKSVKEILADFEE